MELNTAIASVFQILPSVARTLFRNPGPGVARTEARLIEHRKKFDGIDKSHTPTRQGQRAFDRSIAKMQRSARKRNAMIAKLPGGAAAVI